MSERGLNRLIRVLAIAIVLGVAFEAVVHVFDLRGEPSLLERQLSSVEDAVRERPEDSGLRLRLADLYRMADRPDSALSQLEQVLELDPRQSTAQLSRGEILAERGEQEEAAAAFRKLIAQNRGAEFSPVDPQLEAAYYGLGEALLEQGRAKPAVAALRRAVRVEPADADAWHLLGTAALRSGDPRRAVAALRRAVLFVPTGWCEPYERLAAAYRALGRRPHSRYASAMVELCEERTGEAARRLRPLAAGPASADAMLGLGMVAEAESDRAAARRWYRRVLSADPENFLARGGLNRLGGVG